MANHWPNYFWCRILERVEDDTRGGSGRFPPTTCRCNSPAETFGGNEHVGWIFEVILRAGEHSQVITKGSGKDVKWCFFFFRDWCVVVCGTCMVLGRENVVESSIDSSPWKWFQRLLLDVVGTLKHKKVHLLDMKGQWVHYVSAPCHVQKVPNKNLDQYILLMEEIRLTTWDL